LSPGASRASGNAGNTSPVPGVPECSCGSFLSCRSALCTRCKPA